MKSGVVDEILRWARAKEKVDLTRKMAKGASGNQVLSRNVAGKRRVQISESQYPDAVSRGCVKCDSVLILLSPILAPRPGRPEA